MLDSVDPDQTAPQEQSDQDLYCLTNHVSATRIKVIMEFLRICSAVLHMCNLIMFNQCFFEDASVSFWLPSQLGATLNAFLFGNL